jgi:hypothetical protein
VPVDVREEVLDEDLAAELLAEEADVAANDRAQIEHHGRGVRRESCQKLAECLGRKDRVVWRGRNGRRQVGTGPPGCEAI